MKKEDLKAFGLDGEIMEKIIKLHEDTVNQINLRLETTENTVTELKGQISERDKQLEALKISPDSAEALRNEITKLQTANSQAKTDYEKKISEIEFGSALKLAVINDVHDPEDIIGKLDKSKIKLKDGKLEGLDDQLKGLKESKGYLFKPVQQGQQLYGFTPAEPTDSNAAAQVSAINAAFGLTK